MNVVVQGHSGFGDAIHQRAAVRKILARGDDLWLSTAAPCIYHDFPADRLHLLNNRSTLRTQAKNIAREIDRFGQRAPDDALCLRASYDRSRVRRAGSVLGAMCSAFGVDVVGADFRLPVPSAWQDKAMALLCRIPDRPLMVFRPAVARHEWGGAAARNPEPEALLQIFEAISEGYWVVSVADLERGKEWLVGAQPEVDQVFHAGELDFEALAGLFSIASLVYTTPGVGTILAQAVETPCITVFGGYESAESYSGGAGWAPWLAIEPIEPCDCFSHQHACDKRIDVAAAIGDAKGFVRSLASPLRVAL